MKIIIRLFALAAAGLLAGCAQTGAHHSIAAGGARDTYSQNSGHDASADSALPDYRQILSDPGPF